MGSKSFKGVQRYNKICKCANKVLKVLKVLGVLRVLGRFLLSNLSRECKKTLL